MAKIKIRDNNAHKTRPRGLAKRHFEKVYWPYIPVVLAISLLLSIGVRTGDLQAYMRHPGGRVLGYATSMSISGLLADTNSARSSNGVGSLSLNDRLDAAAQAQADDMVARDYWSHYTPDGDPPWVWVTAQGYSYQKLGQNLATGFSDEQSTINAWLASPEHRANLLDPSFKDVGFGFSNNPNYTAAGGGPMTIVVAFYGNPQVLAAATPSSPAAPVTPMTTVQTPASTPTTTQPAATQPSKQPATTQAAKANIAPPVKQTRAQLALGSSKLSSATGDIGLPIAILLGLFWVSRHLRALRKFLLKGERYAIRHPLTDIGLLIIACLLFILSQAAGIIQ
ncbi:MAG: CAP domain-containing protein [Candidatus Saccharimonadales bacterium]